MRPPPSWLTRAAPVLLLVVAVALAHAEIWRAGPAQVAPLFSEGAPEYFPESSVPDVSFEAWLVARNARTLLTQPWRLYDTEHCFPEKQSITFGVSLVGLSVLAMPAALFTREPVLVYNFALLAWSVTAALGMYLLVAGWTRRRAAGVVAALLFAFHPIRLQHVLHPSEWDITWTLFALWFAERLFREGRWRDAVGLAFAGSMQVATSFYTLCAGVLLALPLGVWLALRRPLRVRPAQLAFAVACVALTALLLLGPYLEAREASRIGERTLFFYAIWQHYLPGGLLFFGWLLLLLAVAGAALPHARVFAGLPHDPRRVADPRPWLLAGAALAAVIGAGPSTAQLLGLPVPAYDPYAQLARFVPGLDSVRGVGRFVTAVHAVACVLAGAAVAAGMELAGRRAPWAGALAVGAAFLVSFGAPLPRPTHWRLEPIRPSRETIDFYTALNANGERGPIFELPVDYLNYRGLGLEGSRRLLANAWHGRPTSACFGSYIPATRAVLDRIGNDLPRHWAVQRLHELGFTTVVVHHGPWFIGDPVAHYTRRYHRFIWLDFSSRSENMSAYALHIEGDE
jgi:hypothetical protein